MDEKQEPIEELAEMVRRYYALMRERGIPEELAVRAAGDWHQIMLNVSANEMAHGRQMREISRHFTKNAVKKMGGAS